MASASSMPPTDQRQDLNSLLECSICLETFDEPRTLPCLHSFCKKCLENFVDGKREDELNCPVCRCKFTLNEKGVAGMTRNHFICNMVEVLSIQHQDKCVPCSHCEQASVGRCVTCELFMCEKCLQSHNGYIGFRDHVVLTMEELLKPENQSKIKKISKCTQHPNKKLKYYCDTCDKLICRHCMDFDHDKQHTFFPLEQAAQNKRKDLKKNCEILERAVAKNDKETQVLKEDRELLNCNFDEVQRVLNERKDQLLARLQERLQKKMNSMIDDAHQVFDRKTRNIDGKISENKTFVNRMRASADMARGLLENGNDEEIVRSFQSVQENVNNAKREAHENLLDDVGVPPWNSSEIDTMLLAEITDIVEDKKEIEIISGSNHAPREQDPKTRRNRVKVRNQTQMGDDGFNNENRSPNTSSAAPTGRGPHSLPTYPTSQMNTPLQSGTTQSCGLATRGNVPQTTSAPTSLKEVWDASSHSGQGRGSKMNIPPARAAYSSPRSPQHPSYTQQTRQRSARDRSHRAQHTSQAQAKDRSGTVPVGKMGALGFYK